MESQTETKGNKSDWFDELYSEQQNDVLKGIEEADRGETYSHIEVVKVFEKWGLT
ncbi:hypothetical protein [Mucilaginibacter sp.]|uniref:hypothetical protein n=1 Tax=Mucilaginibacter sp. TaxID=1882438 RepID=UPI003267D3E3